MKIPAREKELGLPDVTCQSILLEVDVWLDHFLLVLTTASKVCGTRKEEI